MSLSYRFKSLSMYGWLVSYVKELIQFYRIRPTTNWHVILGFKLNHPWINIRAVERIIYYVDFAALIQG